MGLTAVQWRALALVVSRADGTASTHVVTHRPEGDAAIQVATATALVRRQLVQVQRDRAWPTSRGRRALGLYHRHLERHSPDRTNAEESP